VTNDSWFAAVQAGRGFASYVALAFMQTPDLCWHESHRYTEE